MSKAVPEISIVMSVFNGENFLKEAIESILRQSFTDFEFVIIDDGSTDSTVELICSFSDPRIVLVRQENAGLSAALNRGVAAARGKYIARMDGDDISDPLRLEKQYNYLETHPGIGILGTWIAIIDSDGRVVRRKTEPTGPEKIKKGMLSYNCFNHGTVMFRKSIFHEAGGYSHAYPDSVPVEDYGLWLRMLRHCDGENIPEYLYSWRQHSASISSVHKKKQEEQLFLVSEKFIASAIGTFNRTGQNNSELAYYHYSLGKIFYFQRRLTECREHLVTALHLDPLVALNAYRYLCLTFISKPLADKLGRIRDLLLQRKTP